MWKTKCSNLSSQKNYTFTWGTWIPWVAKRCLSCKRGLLDTQPHSAQVLGSVLICWCPIFCFLSGFNILKALTLSTSSPESGLFSSILFLFSKVLWALKWDAIESRDLEMWKSRHLNSSIKILQFFKSFEL